MAEILKTYSFKTGRGAFSYPWDEWFDGRIRRLVRGDDFKTPVASFRQVAWAAGKRNGFAVRVNNEGGKSVVMQATPRNGVNGKRK